MPEPAVTSGKTSRKRHAVSPRTHIIIRGARVNMLKNISLDLPRYRLIVITGVSGSGKSSLAFDTIYAEGQRRYVESLSAYARQFLERMDKPDVDYIQGISPAIAIEQKTIARNPRSTVGTTTEIYDYLRLLYGRIGKTYCLNDGELVQRDSVRTVLDKLTDLPDRTRLYITFPLLEHEGQSVRAELENIREQGFARVLVKGELRELDDLEDIQCDKEDIRVVVDRLVWKPGMDTARLADSVQTAFHEGGGNIFVYLVESGEEWRFNSRFECTACHTVYPEPDPKLFSFNNPIGACPTCQGFGRTIGLDMDLIIPNRNKSLREGAVQPWNSPAHKKHLLNLIRVAPEHDVNIDIPYAQLSQREKDFVFNGCRGFLGIKGFFAMVEKKSYKMHYRILHARYRGYTT
ncbi:MAG: excinuclease ABC subunit A, partial [Chlorobi bacterium]|nr:excinuclease ABC subunit A [Chlorobiota bacterium]